MGFFKTPEEMYLHTSKRFKRDADRHWAMAKNGEGDYHYGKARWCYEQVRENERKARKAAKEGWTFSKRGKN